jgi:thioredoxin 1
MAGDNVLQINKDSWQSQVIDSQLPVLVDFWAEWCGPCKAIAPVLDELGAELAGQLTIVKVNVDESPELAQEFGIRSIPTLLVFKSGEVAEKMVGSLSKTQLQEKLSAHI